MSPWDGINRRKFPRITYPCLITVQHTEGEPESVLTHTENVGIGGVCIIMKKNMKMFSTVGVEIDLLDLENHIKCNGRVVWSIRRKYDVSKKPLFYDTGIEFVDIAPRDQERIQLIVNRLSAQETAST